MEDLAFPAVVQLEGPSGLGVWGRMEVKHLIVQPPQSRADDRSEEHKVGRLSAG